MTGPVICIGAALVDELMYASEPLLKRTTNNVSISRTPGGVARNIANQLALLNVPVQLISVVGNDADGNWLKQNCIGTGIGIDMLLVEHIATGKYTGVIDSDGSLFTAMINKLSVDLITPAYLEHHATYLKTASFILVDANISIESLEWLIAFCNAYEPKLIIEPVSVGPAEKLGTVNLNGVYLITPNEDELPAMCDKIVKNSDTIEQVEYLMNQGVQNIWLHMGAEGSAWFHRHKRWQLKPQPVNVVDCTGAGDASVAGFIFASMSGNDHYQAVKTGHALAAEILKVHGAIAHHITSEKLVHLATTTQPSYV